MRGRSLSKTPCRTHCSGRGNAFPMTSIGPRYRNTTPPAYNARSTRMATSNPGCSPVIRNTSTTSVSACGGSRSWNSDVPRERTQPNVLPSTVHVPCCIGGLRTLFGEPAVIASTIRRKNLCGLFGSGNSATQLIGSEARSPSLKRCNPLGAENRKNRRSSKSVNRVIRFEQLRQHFDVLFSDLVAKRQDRADVDAPCHVRIPNVAVDDLGQFSVAKVRARRSCTCRCVQKQAKRGSPMNHLADGGKDWQVLHGTGLIGLARVGADGAGAYTQHWAA
jgi:hypothetical protein